MSIYVDQKYATLIPLNKFERKHHGNYFANFRCPYCGDSKVNPSLKRGWLYNNSNQLTYNCFNCDYSDNFYGFIKTNFPSYFDDYVKEKYMEKFGGSKYIHETKECDDPFKVTLPKLDLTRLGDLPSKHPAIQYVLNRKLPLDKILEGCYYTDNFYDWCKQHQPDTFKNSYHSDRRIIFPFIDREGNIFGASGRSIDNQTPKYLTIKFVENVPKIYGYDKLNIHKTVYVTEGQIDSLFVDNCIGVVGALGGLDEVCNYCNLYDKRKVVLITDNERRNKQTCNFIKKNLEKGYSVVLFPEHINDKDINAMIINGLDIKQIMKMINDNTVFGLSGLARLANWRKS